MESSYSQLRFITSLLLSQHWTVFLLNFPIIDQTCPVSEFLQVQRFLNSGMEREAIPAKNNVTVRNSVQKTNKTNDCFYRCAYQTRFSRCTILFVPIETCEE